MSKSSSLAELYADELKELWSAQDQMRALKKIAPQATNVKLSSMLDRAQAGIAKHTELLKAIIEAN